jgi:amino acid adenylation domain-containing protein
VASLRAGAAFVPLSPRLPLLRLEDMAARAMLDALIVDETGLEVLDRVTRVVDEALVVLPTVSRVKGSDASVLFSGDLDRSTTSCEEAGEDDLAYLLFTSGSTGRPKGVPITHRNVTHFLCHNLARYQPTPEDRFSQFFEQTFDLSVFDLFMAWSSGAAVCVPSYEQLRAPIAFAASQRLTFWFSVPSLVTMLARTGQLRSAALPDLRWSLFCGEPLPRRVAQMWEEIAPGSVLENLYGPTEATIACSAYRLDGQHEWDNPPNDTEPIGSLYPGLPYLIIDQDGAPVPDGIVGELCVGGGQLFKGYWGDEVATAQRCFTRRSGGCEHRYYRTGDLVIARDEVLIHVGRVDHEIKVQGHRVHVGEIEAVLREQRTVVEAVVVPWPVTSDGIDGLTAFVVTEPLFNEQELRRSIRLRLPAHMIPSSIVLVDELPLNPNGKTDREALVDMLRSGDRVGTAR